MLNEEFLIKKILLLIRGYVIRECRGKGFKKTEIAKRLGITSSALAKYEVRKYDLIPDNILREIKEDIVNISQYICSLNYNSLEANRIIFGYWMKWNSKGLFCETLFNSYRKYISAYSKSELCMEIMEQYGRILINSALVEVYRAFEIFRKIPYITSFIPEVSTNIIRLVEVGIDRNYPIIGFPGRIGVFKNRLFTYTLPRIGGSKHMGNILRKLYVLNRRIHGLTGIKYNGKLLDYIDKRKFTISIYSSNNDRELLMKITKSTDLIIDKSGVGREGFIYVSGEDSIDAVKKVESILTRLRPCVIN